MLTKQEIRQLKEKEIQEELAKASNELIKTKMEIQNGYSKESHKLDGLKRYVARLKTITTEEQKKEVKAVKKSK